MIQKFVEIASFVVKHGRGKKANASTSVVVDDVATVLEDGTSSGVQTFIARGIARYLDMPAITVHKIIRKTSCIVIHTKLHRFRVAFCRKERRLLWNFSLAWKSTMNGHGAFCGQVNFISTSMG